MNLSEPGNIFGIQYQLSDYLKFFTYLFGLYLISSFSEIIDTGLNTITIFSFVWLLLTLNFELKWNVWFNIIKQVRKNIKFNFRFIGLLIVESILIFIYSSGGGPLASKIFLFVLWGIGIIPLFALHQLKFIQNASAHEFELCCKTFASSRLSNFLLAYGVILQTASNSSGYDYILLILISGIIFAFMGPLIGYLIDNRNQLKNTRLLLQQLPMWKSITIAELKKRTNLDTKNFLLILSNLHGSDWIKWDNSTNKELMQIAKESKNNQETFLKKIELKRIRLNPLLPIDLDTKKQLDYYEHTK